MLGAVVAKSQFIMVPVRISFLPFGSFTSDGAIYTDLTADVLLVIHVIVSINTAYKNAVGAWVTSRSKIFRKMDILALFAAVPWDW